MRYSVPMKFIAIALTAIALLVGVSSAFGIGKVEEQGLYADGFESWIDNRLEWQAQALAEDLTERYIVKKLTNCEDELLEVTPTSLRMRKRILNNDMRAKANAKLKQ